MKKILFVSHEYGKGGSSESLIALIRGIQEISDIDVCVISPFRLTSESIIDSKKYFSKYGIRYKEVLYRHNYHKIGNHKRILDLIHDLWNFFAVFYIFLYIKKHKIDIVCSNSCAVDVGARAASLAKIPHIFYVREFMEEDHGIEFRNKRRMKRLLEKASGVIFISKAVEQKYINLYSLKKYTQFYNGFITKDYFIPDHEILKNQIIKVVQVGTYSDGKGTMSTLEMFKTLKSNGINNIDLELVGTGNDDYLIKMQEYVNKHNLEKSVTISGFSNNIHDVLLQKDIILINSRSEGFGRVTVEGMLAGCLVIAKNAGGTKEIIEDNRNGLLFENDEDFVEIAMNISDHLEEYRRIAKYGQECAMELYDYRLTAQKFCDFVSEV